MAYATKLFNGSLVIDKKRNKIDLKSHCAGKTIGLYFTALWCPPCNEFLPLLIDFYNKHKVEKKFEIIFISADNDEQSFKECYAKMPWLALDFKDEEKSREIATDIFCIQGIPKFVLFNGDSGEVYTHDARVYLQSSDKDGNHFPWNKY